MLLSEIHSVQINTEWNIYDLRNFSYIHQWKRTDQQRMMIIMQMKQSKLCYQYIVNEWFYYKLFFTIIDQREPLSILSTADQTFSRTKRRNKEKRES